MSPSAFGNTTTGLEVSAHPPDLAPYINAIETYRENSQVAIGLALEKARRRMGHTAAGAAGALRISERELGHFESGLRTPSAGMLMEMAELYGTKVAAFGSRDLALRLPPYIDYGEKILWIGWTPVRLDCGSADNTHVVRSIASALRSMRSLSETRPVYLRANEIPLIGSLLDLEDPDLAATMMHYFGFTYVEAEAVLMRMRTP